MTSTSLPCSKAKSTVIKVPLFFFASTTMIFLLNPLIILFLSGKFIFSGLVPNGNSEIIAPLFSKIGFANLVNKLYPLMGIIGMIQIVQILIKTKK